MGDNEGWTTILVNSGADMKAGSNFEGGFGFDEKMTAYFIGETPVHKIGKLKS